MANEKSNARVVDLYKKYGLTKDDVFKSPQGFVIITRSGIETIQYKENIKVKFIVEHAEKEFVLIKAIAEKDDRIIETLGGAIKGEYQKIEKTKKNGQKYMANTLVNGNTDSWYVSEIAEKRALSRAVLKITGLYEIGFKGEDENQDEFVKASEKNEATAKNVVDGLFDGKS